MEKKKAKWAKEKVTKAGQDEPKAETHPGKKTAKDRMVKMYGHKKKD